MRKATPKQTATRKPATPNVQVIEAERMPNQELVPAPPRQDSVALATQQIVRVISTAVENPKLDVKKMREIMDMQMEMMRFQAEIAYNSAMRDAQAEIPHIPANKYNDHTKSKYADLDAIDTIIKPIYIKHGFSVSFDTRKMENGDVKTMAYVRHTQGHKETHELHGALDMAGAKGNANKTGIQATGSTVSYLQRYLTKLIFNVVIIGEDKDGNATTPVKGEGDSFTTRLRSDKTMRGVAPTQADVREPLKEQAEMMKQDLRELKTKKARLALITSNLEFLRSLDAKGYSEQVAEIHALADQGE